MRYVGNSESYRKFKRWKRAQKGIARKRTAKEERYFINKTARELRDNLPESEVWFWAKWKELQMAIPGDKSNFVKFGKIPDVLNEQYQYIIEVDGGVHLDAVQKCLDDKRDRLFTRGGYLVVRVKAHDEQSLLACVDLIKKRRTEIIPRAKNPTRRMTIVEIREASKAHASRLPKYRGE